MSFESSLEIGRVLCEVVGLDPTDVLELRLIVSGRGPAVLEADVLPDGGRMASAIRVREDLFDQKRWVLDDGSSG